MIRIELSFATPAEAAQAMNRLAGISAAPAAPIESAALDTVATTLVEVVEAARTDAGESVEPAKRKRRTKAEMEAARVAEAAGSPAGEDDLESEDEPTEAPPVAPEPAAPVMPPLSEPALSAAASASAAEAPKSVGAALAELATDEGELALSVEDASTLRRTCVRPALQAIIDKSNNDVARGFLNSFGWKAISEIPQGRIQPFSDAAVSHAATL